MGCRCDLRLRKGLLVRRNFASKEFAADALRGRGENQRGGKIAHL
jgi:hypothetical protein